MTIRQQGGIFGRNPTFNNVSVDGTLTVDQIVEKTGAAGITLDGVTLKDGNVVLANGKGIDFSATAGTGTSELFDDYEEGTFTPKVEGLSSAGTYTYATQSGVYTKVGDLVTVTINLVDITASDAGSGPLRISGLPFSASGIQVGSVWVRSVNFDNAAAYLVPYVTGSTVFINEVVDNATGGTVNIADLTSGAARLYITMTYKV